jgi:hypothetical protein
MEEVAICLHMGTCETHMESDISLHGVLLLKDWLPSTLHTINRNILQLRKYTNRLTFLGYTVLPRRGWIDRAVQSCAEGSTPVSAGRQHTEKFGLLLPIVSHTF